MSVFLLFSGLHIQFKIHAFKTKCKTPYSSHHIWFIQWTTVYKLKSQSLQELHTCMQSTTYSYYPVMGLCSLILEGINGQITHPPFNITFISPQGKHNLKLMLNVNNLEKTMTKTCGISWSSTLTELTQATMSDKAVDPKCRVCANNQTI